MSNIKPLCALNENETLTLAQSGNQQAIEQIMAQYKGMVNSLASKFYMSGLDNEDIIQEGMIGLYNAILNYKPAKSGFRSFAGLCISRKIISALKSTKRQKHIPLNSSLSLDNEIYENSDSHMIDFIESPKKSNPEEIIISNENIERFLKLIPKALTKLELDVFNLYIEGFSYKDIGKFLNKDTQAVDKAVWRIKKKLGGIIDTEE